jgi:hypothetical protein
MRFSGKIGIARGSEETSPGVFEEQFEEIEIVGTMRRNSARWSNMKSREARAKHILSIIPPESSTVDINEVVYIWWKNRQWSVVDIEYIHPSVLLTLGGLYNG